MQSYLVRIGIRKDNKYSGLLCVADPHLGAGDYVVVALFYRLSFQRKRI